MFKKYTFIIITLILLINFSNISFAAEVSHVNENDSQISNYMYGIPTTSATVKDSNGNKYKVYGNTGVSGKTVSVKTEYVVSYIGDGYSSSKVYGYTKVLGAKGNVTMSGGATNTVGSTNHSYTGKTNNYSASKKFLYSVTSVLTSHTFKCNGKSYSSSTTWY